MGTDARPGVRAVRPGRRSPSRGRVALIQVPERLDAETVRFGTVADRLDPALAAGLNPFPFPFDHPLGVVLLEELLRAGTGTEAVGRRPHPPTHMSARQEWLTTSPRPVRRGGALIGEIDTYQRISPVTLSAYAGSGTSSDGYDALFARLGWLGPAQPERQIGFTAAA